MGNGRCLPVVPSVEEWETRLVVMVGTLRRRARWLGWSRIRRPGARRARAAAAAASARVAVTSGVWGVRAEHLDRLPGLGAIVNFGVGYDTTDVDEATRRGVVVSNTPDVLTDCVADTAVGLVIDMMRGLSAADRFVRRGEWADGRTPPLARARHRRSGRHRRAGPDRAGDRRAARGLRHARSAITTAVPARTCRTPTPPTSSRWRRGCDVLVLAAAGGAGSRHLVDAAVLDALGPDGFLVNVARGSVVDEAALVAALEAGRDRRRRAGRLRRRAARPRRHCSAATTSCSCRTSAAPPSRPGRR